MELKKHYNSSHGDEKVSPDNGAKLATDNDAEGAHEKVNKSGAGGEVLDVSFPVQ
jgi:hypothetical protein